MTGSFIGSFSRLGGDIARVRRSTNHLANIAVLFISNNLPLAPLQRDDAREVILEVINVKEKGHDPAERQAQRFRDIVVFLDRGLHAERSDNPQY
jgi:hypothetical protein